MPRYLFVMAGSYNQFVDFKRDHQWENDVEVKYLTSVNQTRGMKEKYLLAIGNWYENSIYEANEFFGWEFDNLQRLSSSHLHKRGFIKR